MKKFYIVLLAVMLGLVTIVGAASLLPKQAAVSMQEAAAQKPELSMPALLDGSYIHSLEEYYTDTFPMRQSLLKANKLMNGFYYYSGSADAGEQVLVIGGNTGAEQGGEALHNVQQQLGIEDTETMEQTPAAPQEPEQAEQTHAVTTDPSEPDTSDKEPKQEAPSEEVQPQEPEEKTPELHLPDPSEATYAGNVVVVGDRAMEIPTATNSVIESYAVTINHLAAALGENVRTISLVTPNGGEFYSPESMHTGPNSQKDMIQYCYDHMDDDIVTVDAYSKIRNHVNEYIYFRTDHHWTQLGAYYAYTAFCEAAGFESVDLSLFQKGRYERFLGSMYNFTSGYPQSEVLKANPDYLEYYMPIAETHAKYYADANLENGVAVSVVYTKLDESVSNKYLCFIGGDTPICIIETNTNGPVCVVLKESYGNAFVPFLTSHYSKIIVIDPREFNRDGKPALDLSVFAAEQEVDDLIVINYPYMINNSYYIGWLDKLAGNT